jgi:hypothetical protein
MRFWLPWVAACVIVACDRDGPKSEPRSVASPATVAPTADALAERSRALAEQLGGALREELTTAMGSSGPKGAISVCHEKAPAIAAKLTGEPGWSVRRTTLAVRNPDNAPDAWERAVLERFEAKRATGAAPDTLEHHEVVREGDRSVFRYMKAIPTAALCTSCHGTSIAPEVAAELDRLYPKDAARGFEVGQLRGAFSVRKEL